MMCELGRKEEREIERCNVISYQNTKFLLGGGERGSSYKEEPKEESRSENMCTPTEPPGPARHHTHHQPTTPPQGMGFG